MAILKLSATALAAGAAMAAQAAPVLVTETVTLGQVLNGNSASFQFDISSALAARGLSAGQAVAGNLIVYGVSDASYAAPQTVPTGDYQIFNQYWYVAYYSGSCHYSFWGGLSCSYYPVYAYVSELGRNIDIVRRDTVVDTMGVTVGAAHGSDAVDQISSSAGGYGSWIYEGQTGGGTNVTRYYNRQRDVYEAVYGDLSVDVGLDAQALADLAADGVLSFDVAAMAGQFRVVSATLNLQVQDPTGLPEPGSLALLATAALTGAHFTRRRRKTS